LELTYDGQRIARTFFTFKNASTYDQIVRFTTFGQDYYWKTQIIGILSKRQMSVLDLACGTGILSSMLIHKRPSIRVIGLDLIFEYLQIAKFKKSDTLLVNGTAEVLPFIDESFDSVVSSYLPKYVNVDILTEECWRVLKHGGNVIFHDFTYPQNLIVQNLWKAYFVILRFMAKFVKSWRIVFFQLDKILRANNWLRNILQSLEKKGFMEISYKHYTLGTAAIISARKP
jgi:demethylmenaquinone methyltransferase / 2-methoxy-6-polyprenyl-1,4-benzoquinol methylase